TVKRPAKDGHECDQQTMPGNVSILAVRLKPDNAEHAKQPKQRSDLKLPLANQVAFLGKKGEREQRRKNYRCPREDGVDARPHVKQRDDLSDLVDNIWQTRNRAKPDGAHIDLRPSQKLKQDERDDAGTGHAVTVKILR